MTINQGYRLIDQLLLLLPTSPFSDFVAQFSSLPWLGVLNWFFPVRQCLLVMAAWLAAITLFYLYSIVMRWVKLIGD